MTKSLEITAPPLPKPGSLKMKPSRVFKENCTPDFEPMNEIVFWNSLGFFFYTFLMRFATSQLLDATGTEMGYIFSAQTVGGLIVTPLVGYLTDRMSKKKLVLTGAVGRGSSYLILYLGLGLNNLIIFGIGVFLLGLTVVFFWTPLNALISQKTHKSVRSTAFGKQAGMLGWGNMIGAVFTVGYYFSMTRLFPDNSWVLFVPLILYCGFNVFAGIKFYVQVDESITFDGFMAEKGVPIENDRKDDSAESSPAEKAVQKRAFLLGMGALMVSFSVSAINQSIPSPFLQVYIIEKFFPGQEAVAVGLSIMLISMPSEVLAQLLAPKMGEWSDRVNPRIAISFICGAGALVTWILINSRTVVAFTVILLVDTSLAWGNGLVLANLMSRISKNSRGKIFSLRQWVGMFGAAIGPILGGYAWEYLGHSMPFIISIFMELLLIPLYWISIKALEPFMEEKI